MQKKIMKKYPIPDQFFYKSSRHCVALFILDSSIGKQPSERDINATLTFVEYNSKTYGITCKHVVNICKNKEESKINTCFATLANGKYFIFNDFSCPPSDVFVYPAPDIAIRQIHPDFPQAIGKIPIKLEQNNMPVLDTIRHVVAAGYPTKEKRRVNVQNGYRIEMPCVHALSEISSIDVNNGQLHLHSELEQNEQQIKDFNGMSGGPVFCSTEEKYGLLGITYEALLPNPLENSLVEGPRIAIKAELVTPQRFKNWLLQFSSLTEEKKWTKNIKLNIYITSC